MKKIVLGIALVLFSVLILYPVKVDSKSQEKQDTGDHYVLIQFRSGSRKCSITTNDQAPNFAWGGWKMQSGITDYQVNFTGMPTNISRQSALAAYDLAFSNIQGAGGGVLFHYAGESSESTPSNDNRNTIMWRKLPSYAVAVTYIWTDARGRLSNADTVFNKTYSWAYTGYNGQNDCGGPSSRFDLRDIATHEFGHWTGMADLYDSASKDLTMYGYASRGELKKDTLGLGDIVGVRSVWP